MKRFYCTVCKRVKRVQQWPNDVINRDSAMVTNRKGSCNHHADARHQSDAKHQYTNQHNYHHRNELTGVR